MSSRTDLWKRLNGETTAKIPWFGDLSYYYFSRKQSGLLAPKYEGAQGELQFYQDYQVGYCFYAPQTYFIEYADGVQFEETTTAEGIYSTYRTKYGELTSVQKYLPSNFSYAYTKHFVQTLEDLKLMAYIYEQMRYLPDL